MADTFAKTILRGGIQPENRGNLANTWIKLSLILLPLSLGGWLVYRRFIDIPVPPQVSEALVTLMLGLLAAQSVDLRPQSRGHVIKWALITLGLEALVLLVVAGQVDLTRFRELLSGLPVIGFLGKFVTFADVLILALFATAARGALSLTATDAWILSGLFSWSAWLRVVYEAVIVSYFTIYHSLAKLLSHARMVARNRYRLLRGEHSFLTSLLGASSLFIKNLLTGMGDKAELTESILTERQWYSRTLRHRVAGGWNVEDAVALVVLALFGGLSFLIIYR